MRGRQHHRIWTLIWGGGNHVAYRPYYYVLLLLLRTTHPCARNKFFKHSYNFLWALPSWKSLAIGHKIMGKITRKNIINICSSYRPCPDRRNMQNPLWARLYKPIGGRLACSWYFPAVPLDFPGLPAPFLARLCLELILRSHRVLSASRIFVVSRLSHAESANLPE